MIDVHENHNPLSCFLSLMAEAEMFPFLIKKHGILLFFFSIFFSVLALPGAEETLGGQGPGDPVLPPGAEVAEAFIRALEQEPSLDVQRLEDFLDQGGDPFYRDSRGYSPCHYAAAAGRPDLLKVLLESCGDGSPFQEDAPINRGKIQFLALKHKEQTALELLKIFHEEGLSVNLRNPEGHSLLGEAIRTFESAALYLLEAGADPDMTEPGGVSPLMLALREGRGIEILDALAQAGADPYARDDEGDDAFTYALLYSRDTSFARRLLSLGLVPVQRDDYGAPGYFLAAAWAADLPLIEHLVTPERGMIRDKEGWVPLMAALSYGNSPEVVAHLSRLVPDGRIRDALGRSLKDYGEIYTSLTGLSLPGEFYALLQRRIYPVTEMPRAHFDEALRNLVLYGGSPDMVAPLVRAGADPGALLLEAAAWSSPEMCQALLDEGACALYTSPWGWTPLHTAAWSSNTETLRLLLAQGWDVDVPDFEGWTPLMWAARNGASLLYMKLLAEAGARGEVRSNLGANTLHLACSAWQEPKPEVLYFLIEKGAEVDARDKGGNTPLMQAALQGYKDTCRWLVKEGADPGLSNRKGLDAAAVARQGGYSELGQWLEEQK